jgi:hypothetical protein
MIKLHKIKVVSLNSGDLAQGQRLDRHLTLVFRFIFPYKEILGQGFIFQFNSG